MTTRQQDLIDNPRPEVKDTAALFFWSTNYDYPTPATLFLDLIGYSDEQYGEPLFDLKEAPTKLGYLEIGMLADALKEYAENPTLVMDWVENYPTTDEEDAEEA